MTLVAEIGRWADVHSAWMSDAVRRLVDKGVLDASDIEDLEAFIKASVGLEDLEGRTPIRLQSQNVPQRGMPGSSVSLQGIYEPRNVNAIGTAQSITFNPHGLNVVYGNNGSGKSGYARALKKACRAKEPELIWPDVFKAIAAGAATARFEWADGGATFSEAWQDGVPSPAALSHIAVFDAHCARVFIDEQAAISYVPYGIDLLTQLSDALGEVQKRLTEERQSKAFDKSQLSSLQSSTEVGRLIGTLGRNTNLEEVQRLAGITEAESAELRRLDELMRAELSQKLAQQIRQFCTRLDTLMQELSGLVGTLGDEAVNGLRLSFKQLLATHEATQLAANAFSAGYLPGTGGQAWIELMQSAMEFAKTPYPNHVFPGPHDASCVLCQQPLAEDASERLSRLVAFLEQDAQAKYQVCRERTKALYQPLLQMQVASVPSDKAFLDDLEERLPGCANLVLQYLGALQARKARIQEMEPNGAIGDLAALPDDPLPVLANLQKTLQNQIQALEKGLTPQQRAEMLKQVEELGARIKLKPLLPVVRAAIAADELDWKLGEAIKCCSTTALTKKGAELYEQTVTADLQEALERELKKLDAGDINLKLDTAGQRGRAMQQLRLVTANKSLKVKPSGILSEGEQRAIAVASFLAEISLEPGASGIVFDDPVTSLDHARRELIAKRLAQEAKQRQVIVFTHDLAFAHELMDAAKSEGEEATVRHVFAAGAVKGCCSDKLPFDGQKVSVRIQELKELCRRAARSLEDDHDHDAYESLIRLGYGRLRDTWELFVEENLFSSTLRRFRRSVQTQKLRYVKVDDADVKAVYDGMSRASRFSHSGGTEAPPARPKASDLLEDVQTLEGVLKDMTTSQKRIAEARVSIGIPLG